MPAYIHFGICDEECIRRPKVYSADGGRAAIPPHFIFRLNTFWGSSRLFGLGGILVILFSQLALKCIQIEKHGIKITFESEGRHYSATYLPGVAAEQGWDKNETLKSLIKKAGYKGIFNAMMTSLWDSSTTQAEWALVYSAPYEWSAISHWSIIWRTASIYSTGG